MSLTAGIDIGSITAKAAVLRNGELLGTQVIFTGYNAEITGLRVFEELVKKLWANGNFLKKELSALGFDTGASETPITPVIIGEAADAKAFSAKLFEQGVFATAIVFPTVPRGTARIRAMVSAAHSEDDLRFAVEKFAAVGREMGIIS